MGGAENGLGLEGIIPLTMRVINEELVSRGEGHQKDPFEVEIKLKIGWGERGKLARFLSLDNEMVEMIIHNLEDKANSILVDRQIMARVLAELDVGPDE